MIEAFRRIGEEISKEFEGKSEIERKKAVLSNLSNKIKTDYNIKIKDSYEKRRIKKVLINLNLNKKQIEIKTDEDLSVDENFVFSPSSPNGKKIDFNTNSLKNLLEGQKGGAIPDLINYLEEDFPNSTKYEEFLETLKNYQGTFYQTIEKKDEKGDIKKNKKGIIKTTYNLNFNLVEDKCDCNSFEELLIKKLNITKKDYQNYKTFFLFIDGKSIQELKFFNEWINIKYYDMIEKYFDSTKGIKELKKNHFNSNQTNITKEMCLPLKFYITDKEKPVFFENFNLSNTYKAFTADKETFEQLLLGTDYIFKNMNLYSFGLNYLLIPKSENFFHDLKDNVEEIIGSIRSISNGGQQKDLEEKKEIERYAERRNWKFDIMFFEKTPGRQEFNVYKIISDLSNYNLEKNIAKSKKDK
jgi:hypothetical protein